MKRIIERLSVLALIVVMMLSVVSVSGFAEDGTQEKAQTLKVSKVLTIKNAKGTKSFKKLKGNKKITINRTSGKVTVKKGLKKGKYKIEVQVTADGNGTYLEGTETKTFTIKVK